MVVVHSLAKDGELVLYAFVVKSAPTTHTFLERKVGEVVHPECRGRGVGYAHLTEREELTPALDGLVYRDDADRDSAVDLLLRHSGLVEEGAGTSADLAVDKCCSFEGELVIYPDVDDVQSEVMLSAKEAYPRSTT